MLCWFMVEIACLSGRSDWIELEFVERGQTPSELTKLGIRLHLAGLSLSDTVLELERFGVKSSRKAAHNWVQKVDFSPPATLARIRLRWTNADPNQRTAVLAVRCSQSEGKRTSLHVAVYDNYNGINESVFIRDS